jgi:hypothetical protein
MATQDLTGGTHVAGGIAYDGITKFWVAESTVDLAGETIADNDAVQCLDILAGTHVLNVFVEVVTAVGATCTATVGDGNGTASWDASADLNAAAGTITQGRGGTDAYVTQGGVTYSSADTIDLSFQDAATSGKFTVSALCVKVS